MIAQQFIDQGYPISAVLRVLKLPRSSFYYRPKTTGKPAGRPISTHTYTLGGMRVSNEQLVADIADILSREFVDYGYTKVTYALRDEFEYRINRKKVYRLMREHGLLNAVVSSPRSPRRWVKELIPPAHSPFSYLEFDIKYIWVAGLRRNAQILSVLDVHSRWLLGHVIGYCITQHDIMQLFDQLLDTYTFPKHAWVRCDNGAQMQARAVQQYFDRKGIIQEFTKPATPEQNAHIESYHSILERVICNRYEFKDMDELNQTFKRWHVFYNEHRIHSSIGYMSPSKYLYTKGYELAGFTAPQKSCESMPVRYPSH